GSVGAAPSVGGRGGLAAGSGGRTWRLRKLYVARHIRKGESLLDDPPRSRETSMRYAICCVLLIAVMILFQWTTRPAADDARTPAAGADADTLTEITVRVPAADLRIADLMNPNVNPIPWRVFDPTPEQGQRTATFRHQAIGEEIVVEGIAWGYVLEPEKAPPGTL